VTLKTFAMGRTQVTFAEYDRFAEATGREKPNDEDWGRGERPVIRVSWHDATAYAAWLSDQTGQRYRLPTEAEGVCRPRWHIDPLLDRRLYPHRPSQLRRQIRLQRLWWQDWDLAATDDPGQQSAGQSLGAP